MIYLIDDKKIRQQELGWSDSLFAKYRGKICPLYNFSDVDDIGEKLFEYGNIVLFHESFLCLTSEKNRVNKLRFKLSEIAAQGAITLAIFSGSQGSRSSDNDIVHLPVDVLYKNLIVFLNVREANKPNMKYLLFGNQPVLERDLGELINEKNRNMLQDSVEVYGRTLFIHPDEDYIQNAISGADIIEVYSSGDVDLHEVVTNGLNKDKYDNIFIPLCFGESLSDYNGLRLAAVIRCTSSINQLSRIFIYGVVGMEDLIDHKFFDILKTKGICLIDYDKIAFQDEAKPMKTPNSSELSVEMKKLKLDIPMNYTDSHSISNEWAIYQWANAIGCEVTEELEKVYKNVECNIYFKFLKTIYPLTSRKQPVKSMFRKDFEENSRILLIDDEANKGWAEIMSHLIGDLNDIYFDYAGHDFVFMETEDIVKRTLFKIKEENIDVVLLDYKLLPSKNGGDNSEGVLSKMILNEIKRLNRGIQVIIFTASSNIISFQEMQASGADGYLVKDGSENTYEVIESFMEDISVATKKACWLKMVFREFKCIEENCQVEDSDYKARLGHNLDVAFDLLEKSLTDKKYGNYAFLQLFLCIEDFVKLKMIFDKGDNKCFVNKTILVAERKTDEKFTSIIGYRRNNKGNYYAYFENEIKAVHMTTDYMISCILIMLLNEKDSSMTKWPRIRDIRNKWVAHASKKFVGEEEIGMIVEFMKQLLNTSRYECKLKGLSDEIKKKDLEALRDRFKSS